MYLYWHQLGEIAALHLYCTVLSTYFTLFPRIPITQVLLQIPQATIPLTQLLREKKWQLKWGKFCMLSQQIPRHKVRLHPGLFPFIFLFRETPRLSLLSCFRWFISTHCQPLHCPLSVFSKKLFPGLASGYRGKLFVCLGFIMINIL